jgi:hypothetical protein
LVFLGKDGLLTGGGYEIHGSIYYPGWWQMLSRRYLPIAGFERSGEGDALQSHIGINKYEPGFEKLARL